MKKWEAEQASKPVHERKRIPLPPESFPNVLAGDKNIEAYNEEASQSYKKNVLESCPNCGRTFLPDRLAVHLRSCNKAHGKPLPGESGTGMIQKRSPGIES